jgi:membrane protein
LRSRRMVPNGRPFGERRSSEEPLSLELQRAQEHDRGRHATQPMQIPRKGWYDILWRTYQEMQQDRLLSIAGGVSFFTLLAIFPAITALVSAYGLFFNPATIANDIGQLSDLVPANVLTIVHEQATRIASNSNQTLSLGLIVGILVSLWSAMSGVKAVIDALNVIYEQRESRSFIKLNLVALVFTLFGFAAFLLAMAAIVVLPLILSPIGFGNLTETVTRIARWPVLLIVLLLGLAILYRYGPDRRAARWQWVSIGSVFATLTWFVASFLFSWYLTNFANYNATYGSLGAVVGLMIWLWISTVVVLLGAELNAEIEHQTARDSTIGAEKPLGARGAVMADTVGAKQA